ncbi:11520_t:CDS:2, partial [Acaulospora morrowiae]
VTPGNDWMIFAFFPILNTNSRLISYNLQWTEPKNPKVLLREAQKREVIQEKNATRQFRALTKHANTMLTVR